MNKDFSRREFLQRSAGATGAYVAARTMILDPEKIPLPSGAVPPSDRVRFGIIGVGMQGSGLLSNAIQLPGVECVAAADLYDGRHTLAKEIAGAKIATTRRYQELLDNKEIDCIVAAVPDHWHRQIVIDAVSAGKDIYCEKPMSHSAADGVAMVAAAPKTGRIVQIGSQRVSSVICTKARELLASGILGTLTLVEGSLGRNDPNGAWEYPPPPDLSPENLDWDTWQGGATKRPWDPVSSPKYFASKMAATCPTCMPHFSITAARRFICASILAAILRKSIAFRGRKEFLKSRNPPSLISRSPAKTNPRAITLTAFPAPCANLISKNGTKSTTPSPAKNPSPRDSPIAAFPSTKKSLTSGSSFRACAIASQSPKTPSSATTPLWLATWPTNPISAKAPSPWTPPPTKSNLSC